MISAAVAVGFVRAAVTRTTGVRPGPAAPGAAFGRIGSRQASSSKRSQAPKSAAVLI